MGNISGIISHAGMKTLTDPMFFSSVFSNVSLLGNENCVQCAEPKTMNAAKFTSQQKCD